MSSFERGDFVHGSCGVHLLGFVGQVPLQAFDGRSVALGVCRARAGSPLRVLARATSFKKRLPVDQLRVSLRLSGCLVPSSRGVG